MNLNKKGMAISGILYSILILFIVLVFAILSLLASTKYSFDKFKSDIQYKLSGDIDGKDSKIIYVDMVLKGADPVLDEGMIPINISDNGTVTKADLYSKWYSYEEKRWANVVLVSDESRENYKNAKEGSIVNQIDIMAYLVWIPRYRYKISTGGTTNATSINIIFENNNKAKSYGDGVSTYFTHPAFTFGDNEVNGIWVGKFETTGIESIPTVLPNAVSLRSQSISKQFETARKFSNYGILSSDSHMMKNSEWGAMAYLSNSTYGINKEIRINNNTRGLTGCGARNPDGAFAVSCFLSYGTETDYPQSTTGNITGIFDTSGGTLEKVMGNLNNNIASSGFSDLPDPKYYDLYNSSDYLNSCNGSCKGDASYETRN